MTAPDDAERIARKWLTSLGGYDPQHYDETPAHESLAALILAAEQRGAERNEKELLASFALQMTCPECGEKWDPPVSLFRHHDHPKGKCTETATGPQIAFEIEEESK